MMLQRFLIVLAAISYSGVSTSAPKVILKLDDLYYEDGLVHAGWLQAIQFLDEENIPAAIGIVGRAIEQGSPEFVVWVQDRHDDGHEIWHHGYCHCRQTVDGVEIREYRGTTYEEQRESLLRAQNLGQEKLGITFRTFGAPYNSTDDYTAEILEEMIELRIWLYKDTESPTEKFVFRRIPEVNIEYPVHVPDFAQFKAGYEKHRNEPVLVIQGHPRSWVDEPDRFQQFRKIVLFLKAQGVDFVRPVEYHDSIMARDPQENDR